MTVKNIVLFDIDGVLFHPTHRVQHWLDGDYDTYFKLAHTDEPIPQGLATCRKFLKDPDYRVLFVTGRCNTEEHRATTLAMLSHHLGVKIYSFQLIMRTWPIPESENAPDADVKPMLLERAGYAIEDVFLVFEDRLSIVNKWRSLGITCYQTDPGWD